MNQLAKLQADIASTAGVTNLNQFVRIGQRQNSVGVVGSWDCPELVMTDDFAKEAFCWMLWQNRFDKGEFLHTTILKEGDEKRAKALCNSMYTGNMTDFYREVMTDLIENGGHMRDLMEFAFGPDRRTTVADEINKDLDAEKAAAARAA
jgi:hypothetical protein